METEPTTGESTFAEREARLWDASARYVRGDISLDELRTIEHPYATAWRAALLTMARRNSSVISYVRNALSILKQRCVALFAVRRHK